MGIFDPDVAARVKSFVDAQVRSFSGDTTPLGDRIMQYALPGSTLLLVSDGYSNSGALWPMPWPWPGRQYHNLCHLLAPREGCAGVEISGTNTAVLAGDYPFTVIGAILRQLPGAAFRLCRRQTHLQRQIVANGSASIKISHIFLETGNHILRATIAPDIQPVNDNYQKAVYVVPKPEVLLSPAATRPWPRISMISTS